MDQAISDRRTTRIMYAIAGVAIALGVLARLHNLRETPMWLDESYSRFAAEHGWWFLWHVIPRYETHPPFYYSLLHLWQAVAGDSLLAYRVPGLLFGFATIAVTGFAARALADHLAATPPGRSMMIAIALGYAAMAPMLVSMSRQVRPYPAMILVYAVATLALLRLANDSAARRPLSRGWIACFFVAQSLMLWLHALGPLFALAMTVALAVCVLRRELPLADLAWLGAGQIVAGVVYLPAFAILLAEAPGWVRSTWLVIDPHTLPDQLGSIFAAPWRPLGCFVALAFVIGMAQFVILKRGARVGAALLVLAGLPVLTALLLSWLVSPVFLTRTLTPGVVPFALGIAMLGANPRLRLVGSVFVALLFALTARYDCDENAWAPLEDWYGTADWIAPRVSPDDAIWAYPNETALPLGYALAEHRHALAIRQIPMAVPALGYPGDHPTGTGGVVAMRPAQIAALAAAPATAQPRTIWLVGLASERLDPHDALLAALLRDRTITQRYRASEIRVLALTRKPTAPSAGRAVPASAAAAR